MGKPEDILLENHCATAESLGFWDDRTLSKSSLKYLILSRYKKEVVKKWFIADIIFNEDNVMLKWEKRLMPLSEEEYKEEFIKAK